MIISTAYGASQSIYRDVYMFGGCGEKYLSHMDDNLIYELTLLLIVKSNFLLLYCIAWTEIAVFILSRQRPNVKVNLFSDKNFLSKNIDHR
jgi:hypothetical protein